MNGFTVKPHHPSAQVQSAIVVEEHAFRHAEDRFPLKFQHSETSRRAVDYPNICSKSVFCDSRTPPNAPALVARYGPFPNVWSQECSSGRTERSIPRGAPPPFQALRRLSDRSIDQALGRVRARGHSYGRVPLQATAKIHVPARAQVYTASATKRKRPTEQAAGR